MRNKNLGTILAIIASSLLIIATYKATAQDHSMHQDAKDVHKVICILHPTEGNDVTGSVTFIQTHEGVKVIAELSGLSEGDHGFHIHEFGDCSAADGTSAGGHFNPEGHHHAGPESPEKHSGDLGNIRANAEGHAYLELLTSQLMLNGPNSIVGRSVVVHADADDLQSQPTGNAGARIACGVIGIAK